MSGRKAKAARRAAAAAAASRPPTGGRRRPRAERRRAERASKTAPPAPAPSARLERADAVWAMGTAALAAVAFASVLESHPGLGDAPESVAGVASTGVLHAPGYPAYVLAAKLFSLAIPLGSLALRVNLFSLVCSAASVAGVFLLARRLRASRPASALGALALALGASFWFYAVFAKHDAFSGLLYLLALHALVSWAESPSTRRLVALGAALGIGMGSSWPLAVLLLPAVGWVLWRRRDALALRGLLAGAATSAVLLLALYGFVMVRAAQHPAVSWGDATTPSRLVALVRRSDFAPQGGSDSARQRDTGSTSEPRRAGPVTAVANDVVMLSQELGLVAVALAGWGAYLSLRRPRGPAPVALALAFATNALATALTVGVSRTRGYDTLLIEGGFLLGAFFVAATWAALGASDLVARAARRRAALAWPALAGLAAAVLVPSAILHRPVAQRSAEPLADGFARAAFAELPPRAVVFLLGAERTQPLIYRQVVKGERRDVTVVATDGVGNAAYRIALARRLGRPMPPRTGGSFPDALRLIQSLRRSRPVFFDAETAQVLKGELGYRPIGLLMRAAGGRGPQKTVSPARTEARLAVAERTAGLPATEWQVWPNSYVASLYVTAGLENARAFFRVRDFAGLRRATEGILAIDPGDSTARRNLAALQQIGR